MVESAVRDLRHAGRLLRRDPAFASVAILSLALGIGANAAIFTILDQLLLRPQPVPDPGQLVMIWTTGPSLGSNQGSRASSYPMYQDFQQRAQAFSHVFCRYNTPLSIGLGQESERVMGELVSGNFFQALGAVPAIGRVSSPEQDDRIYKGHPSVVLSHEYWVTRFAADPGVIGRKILVNNYPMVIVGVSAARFRGIDPARSPQVRVPIQMKPLMTPASDNLGHRRRQWVQVFARTKPGYTAESARASLQPLFSAILREEINAPVLAHVPKPERDRFLVRQVVVESASNGYSDLRRNYSTALVVLMGMVGLVLLTTCVNVASLLVARSAVRQREMAVRIWVGASRARLVRQLLVESALLASAAGVIGVALSVALTRGLLGFLPANGMLMSLRPEPDWRILIFGALLAFASTLVFGLMPAWRAARVDVSSALKEASGAVAGGRRLVRLRKGLVAAQVAFSFLLLVAAGLLVGTLANLKRTPAGFGDLGRLVTFQIDPARSGYSLNRLKAFYADVLERLRTLPSAESAGFAWVPLLSGREADWSITVEGSPANDRNVGAYINALSPGYWRTMSVPLLDGRDFDARDVDGAPKVAIVNRSFVTHYFGSARAIGRRLVMDTGPRVSFDIEIVGVAEDSLYEGPRQGVRRQVFLPFAQLNQPVGVSFYVRTSSASHGIVAAARGTVAALDPTIPIYETKTLERQLDETLGSERMAATLSAAMGALATLLAAVGLYGVLTLVVTFRTRELGLRVALGARPSAVSWMVLKDALGLLALGLGVGVPCAGLLGRLLTSQLFGVPSTDLATAAIAAGILAAVTTGAASLPARRASTIDPIRALRHE